MIEILINILAGILLITIIYFLIQYALKFRQERLIQEDYRNKVREQENLDERTKNHQSKLASGYKYYEWKGTVTWVHRNMFDPSIIMKTTIEHKSGEGYFKSQNDLENYLLAQSIILKWNREV